jgi:putative spermidine/putrescine transport system ATP-binding protein
VGTPPYARAIGMVFQNYSLFPHMTVFDNVAFPLRMRKVPKVEIETRVRRMLDVVRLPDVGERMPSQLSGGQQQRIALARAAIYGAPLLLMDEPLGALDKNLREEMQFEIRQFHHDIGATIMYVTHDQDEAATMSSRMAILNRGRVEQVGSPRELYEQPANAFVASFLGQANLFNVVETAPNGEGRVTARTDRGLRLIARAVPSLGKRVVACVRPEAVLLDTRRPATANALSGVVQSCVFTAGSMWYRVRVGDVTVSVRRAAQRTAGQVAPGANVHIGWECEDTLLINAENEEESDGGA